MLFQQMHNGITSKYIAISVMYNDIKAKYIGFSAKDNAITVPYTMLLLYTTYTT